MRISDWSSDVCSSDLTGGRRPARGPLPFFTPTAGAEPLRRIGRTPGGCVHISRNRAMAKPTTVKIKLVSTADTGFFYVTKQNPRTMTEKMSVRKYDPRARKHVEFKEAKTNVRTERSRVGKTGGNRSKIGRS